MARIFLLTGRIGSGKSSVGSILKECGHRVISMDDFAKSLMKTDDGYKMLLLKTFGKDVLTDDMECDVEWLREHFFEPLPEYKRKAVEGYIFEKFGFYLRDNILQLQEVVFVEAAEIASYVFTFEKAPFYSGKIVVKMSDRDARYERVCARSHLTLDQVRQRDVLQSDMFIVENRDTVLYNDGTLQDLRNCVTAMLRDQIGFSFEEQMAVFQRLVSSTPFNNIPAYEAFCHYYKTSYGCSRCPFPCWKFEPTKTTNNQEEQK